MRLCNWVLLDETGEHPLGTSAAVECSGLASLRFETAFFFETTTLEIIWSDDQERTLFTDKVIVSRETIAVFLPIPTYLQVPSLHVRIFAHTYDFKALTLTVSNHASSRLALYAFVQAAQDSYFARHDWIRGLPFSEMLRLTHDAITAKGATLVFVTGSVGKTSTKEFIAHWLRNEHVYHSTDSWNYPHEMCAQILLNIQWARYFVMEVAVGNHLRIVGELLPPSVLVFTHLGPVHTAQFASILDIGIAKAALAAHMTSTSTVVFNADIPEISEALHRVWAKRVDTPKTISFSTDASTDADVVSERDPISRAIRLVDRRHQRTYAIDAGQGFKIHHGNLAAAYCVCSELTSTNCNPAAALETFPGVPRRLEIETLGETILINDAYNANPVSMREFLDTVYRYRSESRQACIIVGEMADLGGLTLEQHHTVLQLAQAKADVLVLVGATYQKLGGDTLPNCTYFATWQDILNAHFLAHVINQYKVIGVKGSYSTGMLHIAAQIKQLLLS